METPAGSELVLSDELQVAFCGWVVWRSGAEPTVRALVGPRSIEDTSKYVARPDVVRFFDASGPSGLEARSFVLNIPADDIPVEGCEVIVEIRKGSAVGRSRPYRIRR